MATTLISWRPSALPAACPSIVSAPDTFPNAQVHVLGQSAVRTVVRTEPVFGRIVPTAPTLPDAGQVGATKINNYIGTPAAEPALGLAVEGATTSSLIAMAAADLGNQQLGVDKVKGSNARGIPPRGWRTV